jgi:hypothetical protein
VDFRIHRALRSHERCTNLTLVKSLQLVTAPSLARAAGCSIATVLRRVADGTLSPDGWLEGGSVRQPVFRADRVEALRGSVLPKAPHLRRIEFVADVDEPSYTAAAVAGTIR